QLPELPPRVEYALTDKGRALLPMIEDMRCFGEQWLEGAADTALVAPGA
ncbi:MAG: winged helix-turn-helix transcriptional regulator, partial [Solirubrobacteraceae bacterium]|nr:winged helix-turn-helix transcriptional regulator [Solirubrobacteraceae bacterium]